MQIERLGGTSQPPQTQQSMHVGMLPVLPHSHTPPRPRPFAPGRLVGAGGWQALSPLFFSTAGNPKS